MRLLNHVQFIDVNLAFLARDSKARFPTYDVFDEEGDFESGPGIGPIELRRVRLGVSHRALLAGRAPAPEMSPL